MLWEFKIPKIILLSNHRRGSEHGSIPSNVLAHPSKLDLLASNRFSTSKANSKESCTELKSRPFYPKFKEKLPFILNSDLETARSTGLLDKIKIVKYKDQD